LDGEIGRYWSRSKAGPVGIPHPAMFDFFGDFMPLNQLDTCLTGLKQQGIPVSRRGSGDSGNIFKVMAFTLTAEQIIELHENGQMDANGIKAFAKSIKQSF
jgi:hypothetical protein